MADVFRSSQVAGCCTWCGHPGHGTNCREQIKVAAGPSGGPGRGVPTKIVPCPCEVNRG